MVATIGKLATSDYYLLSQESLRSPGEYYVTASGEEPDGKWYDPARLLASLAGGVSEADGSGSGKGADGADKMPAGGEANAAAQDGERVPAAVKQALRELAFPEGASDEMQDEGGASRGVRPDGRPIPAPPKLTHGGRVDGAAFTSLYNGFAPDGSPLVQNAGAAKRAAGLDITFSADKSISSLWAIADEKTREAIEAAQEAAVRTALDEIIIPNCSNVRIRDKDGKIRIAKAEILAATFQHGSSREGDPQLHTHCTFFNVARTIEDGKWRALYRGRPFFRWKMAAGAVYRMALAAELQDRLGVEIEQYGKEKRFSRIVGMPEDLEELWSKRRQQIVSAAAAQGWSTDGNADRAAALNLNTRDAKHPDGSSEARRERWNKEAREVVEDLDALVESLVNKPQELTPEGLRELTQTVENVAKRLTRDEAVFLLPAVYEHVANACAGRVDFAAFRTMVERVLRGEDVQELDVREAHVDSEADLAHTRIFTTRDTIRQETEVQTMAESMAKDERFGIDHDTVDRHVRSLLEKGYPLSGEQVAAIFHLTSSGRVSIVEGAAGSGKSTTLRPVVDLYRSQGCTVIGTAIAWRTAQALGTDCDIPPTSVARLLKRASKGQVTLDDSTVIVVDEAGMLATRQMHRLQELSEETGCKLILCGDTQQQQPVEAGPGLRLVRKVVGSAGVTQIRRQRADLEDVLVHVDGVDPATARFQAGLTSPEDQEQRLAEFAALAEDAKPDFTPWQVKASEAFRDGEAGEAIEAYRSRGHFHVGADLEQTLQMVVDDWSNFERQNPGKSTVVLARTHAEIGALSHMMRERVIAGDAERAVIQVCRGRADTHDVEPLEVARGDRLRIGATVWDQQLFNGSIITVTDFRWDGTIGDTDTPRLLIHGRDEHGREVSFHHDAVRDWKGNVRLNYGYAVTITAAQGMTVDQAFLLADDRPARETIYPACTRHREGLDIYVNRQPVAEDILSRRPEDEVDQPVTDGEVRARLAACWSRSQPKVAAHDHMSAAMRDKAKAEAAATRQTDPDQRSPADWLAANDNGDGVLRQIANGMWGFALNLQYGGQVSALADQADTLRTDLAAWQARIESEGEAVALEDGYLEVLRGHKSLLDRAAPFRDAPRFGPLLGRYDGLGAKAFDDLREQVGQGRRLRKVAQAAARKQEETAERMTAAALDENLRPVWNAGRKMMEKLEMAPTHDQVAAALTTVSDAIFERWLPQSIEVGGMRVGLLRNGDDVRSIRIGIDGPSVGRWTEDGNANEGDLLDVIAIAAAGGDRDLAVDLAVSFLWLNGVEADRIAEVAAEVAGVEVVSPEVRDEVAEVTRAERANGTILLGGEQRSLAAMSAREISQALTERIGAVVERWVDDGRTDGLDWYGEIHDRPVVLTWHSDGRARFRWRDTRHQVGDILDMVRAAGDHLSTGDAIAAAREFLAGIPDPSGATAVAATTDEQVSGMAGNEPVVKADAVEVGGPSVVEEREEPIPARVEQSAPRTEQPGQREQPSRSEGPGPREIAAALAGRVEDVCRHYLPGGRRDGTVWRVGSVRGESGNSMTVDLTGAWRGYWKDWATNDHGDLLDLIKQSRGSPRMFDAMQEAVSFLGGEVIVPVVPPEAAPRQSRAKTEGDRRRMERLLSGGRPVRADNPAGRYLQGRGLPVDLAGDLLWHPAANVRVGDEFRKLPAVLAPIRTASGGLEAIHRIFITEDGQPADIPARKRNMCSPGGGGVWFGNRAAETAVICEGIEDAMAIASVFSPQERERVAIVASTGAGRMHAVELPAGVRRLVLVRDHGAAGEKSWNMLEERYAGTGVAVECVLPVSDDANAELQERGAADLRRTLAPVLDQRQSIRREDATDDAWRRIAANPDIRTWMAQDLEAELKRLGLGSVGLRLSDSLRSDLEGRYTAGLIEIALDRRENMFGALRHESIHALKALGAFSEDQWGVLEAAAKAGWVDDPDLDIRRRYGHLPEDTQIEEAIAEAFRRWYSGQPLAVQAGGLVETVFRWIAEVFNRIRTLFRQRDLTSAEAIFRAVDRGEFRARAEKASVARDAAVEAASRSREPQPLPSLADCNLYDGLPARPYLLDKWPVPVVDVVAPFGPDAPAKAFRDWGRARYKNAVYTNADTGLKIAITRKSLDHVTYFKPKGETNPMQNHTRGTGNLAFIAGLDKLLETCIHFESEPNRKHGKKNKGDAYHHFVVAGRNGDEARRVRLTVEKTARGYRLYDMASVAISKDPIFRLASSRWEGVAPYQGILTAINIKPLWQKSKSVFSVLLTYRGRKNVLDYQNLFEPYQRLRRDWNALLSAALGQNTPVTSMEGYADIRRRMKTVLSDQALADLKEAILKDPNLGDTDAEIVAEKFDKLAVAICMERDRDDSVKLSISRNVAAAPTLSPVEQALSDLCTKIDSHMERYKESDVHWFYADGFAELHAHLKAFEGRDDLSDQFRGELQKRLEPADALAGARDHVKALGADIHSWMKRRVALAKVARANSADIWDLPEWDELVAWGNTLVRRADEVLADPDCKTHFDVFAGKARGDLERSVRLITKTRDSAEYWPAFEAAQKEAIRAKDEELYQARQARDDELWDLQGQYAALAARERAEKEALEQGESRGQSM